MAKRKRGKKALPKLLFVDTNIWLDFYRPGRSDTSLKLLARLEEIADRIIVTDTVEMEFKKNRVAVVAEALRELKAPQLALTHGIFSDAKSTQQIQKSMAGINMRLEKLRAKLVRALDNPPQYDAVYKVCQRIMTRDDDDLVLKAGTPAAKQVHRRALRRFLSGCPPRKPGDTSIGDAYNWEWMLECADKRGAELVILSRDSDYGHIAEKKPYVNEYLRQELKARVSKQRNVYLCNNIAQALKMFGVAVTKEEKAEEAVVSTKMIPIDSEQGKGVLRIISELLQREYTHPGSTSLGLGTVDRSGSVPPAILASLQEEEEDDAEEEPVPAPEGQPPQPS